MFGYIPGSFSQAGRECTIIDARNLTDPHVLFLDDPSVLALPTREVGGKIHGLAKLVANGLPVPAGFVIPQGLFASDGKGRTTELSAQGRQSIESAYLELGRRSGQPDALVAVRSSGSLEDGTVASFAGQYSTFLNVRGFADVLDKVEHCIRSLSNDGVDSYRNRLKARDQDDADNGEARMAVLVQIMVASEVAGVAFTADPISGDASAVVLNSAPGLGTAVVDGTSNCDRWWVDRATCRIVRHEPGETMPDGYAISASEIARVTHLALQAEVAIGTFADVEWAISDGTSWLLQARPITALPSHRPIPDDPSVKTGMAKTEPPRHSTSTFPFEWPDDGLSALHWRREGRAGDKPVRPMEVSERESFLRAARNAASILGSAPPRRLMNLHGYRFSTATEPDLPESLRTSHKATFDRAMEAIQATGRTYWEAVLFPEIDAGNRRIDAIKPETLSNEELSEYLKSVFTWHERLWTLHAFVLRSVRFQSNTFREQLARHLVAYATADQSAHIEVMLSHVPTKTTQAIDAITELAAMLQERPGLAELFLSIPGDPDRNTAPETRHIVDRFESRLEELLTTHSLRADAGAFTVGDFCQPGWRDRPELVFELIRRYVHQDLQSIPVRKNQAVEVRDILTETVRACVSDAEAASRFDVLVDAARREVHAYENHNYHVDAAASALLWRGRSACGARLAQMGTIASPDDVVWLYRHEIEAFLCHSGPDQLAATALVAGRKAIHAWASSLEVPGWLGVPPEPTAPASPNDASQASTLPAPPNALVAGQPGSRGTATGRVRLVPPDATVPMVEPGDVLVARNAGALWAPIFPLATAVILDEGALFQHAMLTCREFRVPGVIQTRHATTRLHEGQIVTVDGTNGWVLPGPE
ncbi:MAG: PEP-utilizing enzyme [Chloroflexi bacterium]|nr:PEP-utilizing enzyme [Chloroflexota bacterium]